MEITAQRPQIGEPSAFLHHVAGALEKMHAQHQVHGYVFSQNVPNWLAPTNSFDVALFVSARAPADALPAYPDLLEYDVRCFADLAVEFITGHKAAPGTPFRASFYRGQQWPDEFLDDIEKLSAATPSMPIAIGKLSAALRSVVPTLAAAPPIIPPVMKTPFAASRQSPPAPAFSFALRNGTVGKSYHIEPGKIAQVIATQRGENPELARVAHLQLPDDCGLVFDAACGSVTGIPTLPFDGELSLEYLAAPGSEGVALKVKFLINPDPASLWKDLPPPADAPYQKELLEKGEYLHGNFRVVAASRRGRSHANKGEFRDDDYAIGYAADTQWLVVVVADGAGSATYSRRGSQIACQVAKSQLTGVLNSAQHNVAEALHAQHRDWQHPEVKAALRQILYDAALLAHHKLREEVTQPLEALPAPPTLRNYDTTLILLAMKRVGEGCIAATFSIGDGGAGIMLHPGEGQSLTIADSGEHAGQTTFLTFADTVKNDEANLAKRYHQVVVPEFAGALVMTDGITDPKFPSDSAFDDPSQWAALWGELQPVLASPEALLDWLNFFSPGNHDDRTLVAILPI